MLISAALACIAAGHVVAAPSPPPVLRVAGAVDPAWADRLAADRLWLAALPPRWSTLAADPDSAAIAGWLRQAIGDQALVRDFAAVPGREQAAAAVSTASLLRDRWLARGHLAAAVATVVGRAGTPDTLVLDPGPAFRVGRVAVSGPDFPGRARILARILPETGASFDPAGWDAIPAAVLKAAGDDGHPFARWVVDGVRADPDRSEVDVSATLFIGPVSVVGPQTTTLPAGRGEEFALKAAGLSSGRAFDESELRAARERLLLRDIYDSVGEPEIFTTAAPGTVGVRWPLAPVPRPNRFAAVLGFSRAAAGEPSRLSGQVDLLLANLAGTGRRLALAWSDDGRDVSHFGFEWGEPLVFGTPFDAAAALDHEVRKNDYTRFRFDLDLELPVAGAWGLALGAGWDRSTFPSGDFERTSRLRTSAAFRKKRTDRLASGWEGDFEIETARRRADLRPVGDQSAGLGSVERQTILDVRLAGEMWMGSAVSLAGRGRFQDVAADGAATPLSEQFRFGGALSVRGYQEDSFHGERVTWGGVELRLGRPGSSRLYTFFDMGYFRFSTIDPDDSAGLVRRSDTVRGFGLGIETRAAGGDVSLAVGLPGTFDFEAAMLHVSLLQAF